MKDYLKTYIDETDKKIEIGKNLDSLKKEHLVKIDFFQKERIIHLIVTMFFSAFLILFLILLQFNSKVIYAILIIFIVLIFYIIHYYRLENGVQYMYKQYDILLEKLNKKTK